MKIICKNCKWFRQTIKPPLKQHVFRFNSEENAKNMSDDEIIDYFLLHYRDSGCANPKFFDLIDKSKIDPYDGHIISKYQMVTNDALTLKDRMYKLNGNLNCSYFQDYVENDKKENNIKWWQFWKWFFKNNKKGK